MKQVMSTQTSACEDLRVVTVDIRQRLCAIEKPDSSGVTAITPRACEVNQACGSEETSSRKSDSATLAPGRTTSAAKGATSENGIVMSPKWTRVVKEGRRLKHDTGKSTMSSKPRLNPSREKKTTGIVGTCAGGSIQAITTKSVSVFATRFSPDLEPATLAIYLKEKLGRDVICEKVNTVHARFGSFKVTALCREVGEMYEPQLWPEGTFVRRFFEARKPRAAAGPVDEHARKVASESGSEM